MYTYGCIAYLWNGVSLFMGAGKLVAYSSKESELITILEGLKAIYEEKYS